MRRATLPVAVVGAMLLALSVGLSTTKPLQAAPIFTVDSKADAADANAGDGTCATSQNACTLRAAIEESNLRSGPDAISFDIPGTGVQTITLGSALPTISDRSGPTTIDGYTQPGSSPNTAARLSNAVIGVQVTAPDGATSRDGIRVTSPDNLIRGLAFFKLRKAITLSSAYASGNTISGNFVGTNAAGDYAAIASAANADGVSLMNGAHHNAVGGTSVDERNVVSGNGFRGVFLGGEGTSSNRVVNNIVGLGPKGDKRLSNIAHGIDLNVGASENQIGGTLAGERNVVSGNGDQGVEVSHQATTVRNRVVGNYIGTDVTGNGGPEHAKNGGFGVMVEDRVRDNEVVQNVIGNNLKGGVLIQNNAVGTIVRNNRIGVSPNGSSIPNGSSGLKISLFSSGSRIGPNNVIAGNGGAGVIVTEETTDHNTISRNSIFGNGRLGIDLEPSTTPNENDPGDADTGPNEQLNFPVIDRATLQEVTGSVCGGCKVEVFLADGGPGAYGQGKTLVGSATAKSDGTFAVTVSGAEQGNYVTTTATDAVGNTSEFSLNRAVTA